MHQFIAVLIGGVGLGAVYAVNAVGVSLVYGVARVFNFAYAMFFTWGAYLAWVLMAGALRLSYPLMFIIVVPVLFLAGMLLERTLIRPLRWRSEWQITTMIVTLGLGVLMDSVALIVFGPLSKNVRPLVTGFFTVGGYVIGKQDAVMVVCAVGAMVLLETFLTSTRSGRAMRAVAQDMRGAQIVGIPLNRIFGYAFGISTVLAALAGILLAPVYLISHDGGWDPFFKAFVIVVLGGLGSTKGTVIAAFLLGLGEALVTFQFGASWNLTLWFCTLLVVLVVKPAGLMGRWT